MQQLPAAEADVRFVYRLVRVAYAFPVYAFVAMLLDVVLGLMRLMGN